MQGTHMWYVQYSSNSHYTYESESGLKALTQPSRQKIYYSLGDQPYTCM